MKVTPFILVLAFMMLFSLVSCGDVSPTPLDSPIGEATNVDDATPLTLPTSASARTTATQDPTPQRSMATSTVMPETTIRATTTPDNSELPLSSGG